MTIVILAEFAAPQTTRSVSLVKTQIPMRSSVQRKTDRDFGKFRNYRQKIFMLFHIYKFLKSHQKSEPELGMSAE